MKTKPIPSFVKTALRIATVIALVAPLHLGFSAAEKSKSTSSEFSSAETLDAGPTADQLEEARKLQLQPAVTAQDANVVRPVAQLPKPAPAAPNGGPIVVTATAGTLGPTLYANLGAAFNAINGGVHQGSITVSVQANSNESQSAVLNSSGAGAASYNSIVIRPTVDGVVISGVTGMGRGLIELNGADNVTIDGDNPNSAGTHRDLTIQNASPSALTFAAVVRIALATTVVSSADNNTIKNVNIIGNSPGRNISSATTTTGTENTTFGIFAGPGASTTTATATPAPITSVSTTVGAGATAANLFVNNNTFSGSMARAITINGGATTVFPGVQLTGNSIGNQIAGSPDQVTAIGITVQGSANALIAGNVVYVEGFIASSSANHAINVGVNSTAVSGALIDSNKIARVRNNNPTTWSAFGIDLGGGNNHIVQNNFVSDIRNDQTAGTGAFGSTFCAMGVRVASGTGHKIYHNSVHLFGVLPGATSTDLTVAFGITGTGLTGCDVRNNIFSNQLTGGNPTPVSTRHACVFLPSGGTASMNLTWNNNDYFQGPSAAEPKSELAQVGGTAGTGEYYAADFDPANTTPPANFRAYTSTLSAAGTNDNASKKVDPQFVANTDLHISGVSPMINMGVDEVVKRDTDGELRVSPPDIGADEANGPPPPANDIAATAILNPPNGSSRPANSPFAVQASFTNVGAATQFNVPVRFKILNGMNVEVYNQPTTVPAMNSGQSLIVSFPNAVLPAGTYTTKAIAENPGDENPANDMISGTLTVVTPLCGTVTVGAGGTYPSLTNPGGLFDAINAAGLSCPLNAVIVSDLTNETGAIPLNQWTEVGPNGTPEALGVTIRPPGLNNPERTPPPLFTISGSNATALIRIVGADLLTINGSFTGVASGTVGGDPSLRQLTFQNTNPSTTSAVIAVMEGTNGANDVTIKNVNVIGADPTQTLAAIHIGGNTVGTAPVTANNNNARVENCSLQKAFVGVFDDGISPANPATGNVITLNDLSGTGTNRLRRVGLFMFNQNGIQVTGNSIGGINTDESADAIGIVAGIQNVTTTASTSGGISNANILRNRINGVVGTSTVGFSSAGIAIAGDPAGMNTIANNMITGITSPATSPDIVAGVFVAGVAASNTKIYFNSVALTGDRIATAGEIGSYGIAISGASIPQVDVEDNIFYTTQTSSGGGANAKSYVLGTQATAAALSGLISNHNLYFGSGPNFSGFRTASLDTTGTDFATLAAWQAATGKDANSLFADPVFVSPTNELHIGCGSPAANNGVPLASVAVDIDNQSRDGMTPDIGADEQTAPLLSELVSRKVHAGNTFDIQLPGVECRLGANPQIVFTFVSPVTFTGAAVTSGVGMVSTTTGNGTNTIVVNLSGVTNAQYIEVTLGCVSDGINVGDLSAQMGVLFGDVNGNAAVNASDVSLTKTRIGQLVTSANFRSDINVNGVINASDLSQIKTLAGTALPPVQPLGRCFIDEDVPCTGPFSIKTCSACLPFAPRWQNISGFCFSVCPP